MVVCWFAQCFFICSVSLSSGLPSRLTGVRSCFVSLEIGKDFWVISGELGCLLFGNSLIH